MIHDLKNIYLGKELKFRAAGKNTEISLKSKMKFLKSFDFFSLIRAFLPNFQNSVLAHIFNYHF